MKICQIFGGKGEGGLEKHVLELSSELNSKGLNVTVIAHEKYKPLFSNMHFIALDLTKSRVNIFLLYKLYKIFKNNKFDIIHSHANKATYMLIKIKPFISSKIIATLHNNKNNVKNFDKCDYVITVSNRITKKLKIKNQKTIYNGLEEQKIEKLNIYDKYHIEKNNFIIFSVGRLVHVKRFDVLISSLSYLKNIHLILAGTGGEEKKLISLAKKLDVHNKITFLGSIPNKLAKELMASSDLFVLTSDKEGFGYVFAESLIANTPIISTNVADIKEFIGEKYIIPFNDPKALSNKIDWVKNNYDNVQHDFNNGIFQKAKQTFTVGHMADQVISVYNKILKDSSEN